MPRIKLTSAAVTALPAPDPSGKQVLYWDDSLTGFGVLASGRTTAKTFIVQRDLPGGKTRRVTIGPTNVLSPAEARKRAASVLAGLLGGTDPKVRAQNDRTLAATLDAYLLARADLRPDSRKAYRIYVRNYLEPWLERPLRSITPEMVEAHHRVIASDIKSATGRYSGSASANMAMKTLRALWNWAADRDPTLGANPVRRLKRAWFPVPRRTRYLTAEQLPTFYAATKSLLNPVHRDFLQLLLFSGLRRGEAASLRWENVDLHNRVLRIPAARTKANRKLDLPMTDLVFGIFVERQRLGRDASGFVFPASSATGYLSAPESALTQIAIATGIKVSAHDLRRTYITIAESTDISPIALKALVNHGLGGDVTSGYIQMTVERLREPAQKVADRMKSLMKLELPAGVAKISV
jgi:integrase